MINPQKFPVSQKFINDLYRDRRDFSMVTPIFSGNKPWFTAGFLNKTKPQLLYTKVTKQRKCPELTWLSLRLLISLNQGSLFGINIARFLNKQHHVFQRLIFPSASQHNPIKTRSKNKDWNTKFQTFFCNGNLRGMEMKCSNAPLTSLNSLHNPWPRL